MTTVTTRTPRLRVYIDGREVGNILSVRGSCGLDLRYSEATITLAEMPSWAKKWSLVEISAGPTPQLDYGRFAGFFVESRRKLWPRTVELYCAGPLVKAAQYSNPNQYGTDYSGGGTVGATDEAMVAAVMDTCGLDAASLWGVGSSRVVLGTGVTAGTISYDEDDDGNPIGPFVWRSGETALDYIQRLDEVSIAGGTAYRTYGSLTSFGRTPVTVSPGKTPAYSFSEGVDIEWADYEDSVLDIENRIIVDGYDDGDGPVYATASQLNPQVAGGTGYHTFSLSNPMIERAGTADAGTGWTCQEVANYHLTERNRERIKISFRTPRGEIIAPSQTVGVYAPVRLGGSANYWVQNVEWEVTDRREWSQRVTVIGGNASTAPVDQNPLPDFSMRLERERYLVGGTAAGYLHTAYCQSAALGLTGEVTGWTWTATNGLPATGAESTFASAFASLPGTISLQVSDEHGRSGTLAKALPAATAALWVDRKLYAAGTAVADEWAGGTIWRTATPTDSSAVMVVANGPMWGAGTILMYSADDLVTVVESAPFGGAADVSAVWVETDVNTTRILAGGSNGDIAYSDTGTSAWTVKDGPGTVSVLKCVINRANKNQFFLLDANGLYDTVSAGDNWATLVAAAGGETFIDLSVSHSRWMIGMSGGRIMCDNSGAQQYFEGSPSEIAGVAPDIREDRFYAYDGGGTTWYHASDGGSILSAGTVLPAGVQPQARGLWRDGEHRALLYIAGGTAGLYKSVDAFGSAEGYFRIRAPGVDGSPAGASYEQVGANGLVSPIVTAGTTIYSDSVSKVWIGAGSPASDWYTIGYDDSSTASWAAATQVASSAYISGATAIWRSGGTAAGTAWFRRSFTLGDGVVSTVEWTDTAYSQIAERWINGQYAGQKTTDVSVVATVSADAGLIRPGAANVLAYKAKAEA